MTVPRATCSLARWRLSSPRGHGGWEREHREVAKATRRGAGNRIQEALRGSEDRLDRSCTSRVKGATSPRRDRSRTPRRRARDGLPRRFRKTRGPWGVPGDLCRATALEGLDGLLERPAAERGAREWSGPRRPFPASESLNILIKSRGTPGELETPLMRSLTQGFQG